MIALVAPITDLVRVRFAHSKREGTKRGLLLLCGLVATGAVNPGAPHLSGQEPTPTGALVGAVVAKETGNPLPGIAVEVRRSADSSRVEGGMSDENGRFLVRVQGGKGYFLRIWTLGRTAVTSETFDLRGGETRDFGTLELAVKAIKIGPIKIAAEPNAVTFGGDRTSYTPAVLGGADGASVTEMLQMIPGLQIDLDGNVHLRGQRPAVFIDGRPAPMTGQALALFLENFPAAYLTKVEVLETPSARYAAEGSGGIVNLVLKEGTDLGLSGSIFTRAGTRGQYGVGAGGTLHRGRWTFGTTGAGHISDVERTTFDLRQHLLADPPFLHRETSSDNAVRGGNFDFRSRFDASERSRLVVILGIGRFGSKAKGLSTTIHMDDTQSEYLRYDRGSLSRSASLDARFTAAIEYDFNSTGQKVEVEANFQATEDVAATREEMTSDELLAENALVPSEVTLDRRRGHERDFSLQVAYTHPSGEQGHVETGVRIGLEDDLVYRVIRFIDDPDTGSSTMVRDRSYAHRQIVSAGYLTVAVQGGALAVRAGLRGEHTMSLFRIRNRESFRNHDLHLFPSANVSYAVDRSKQIRLSYSRRVQRPHSGVLNPVDHSTDPVTRLVGNPDIEPEFTHFLALSASQSGAIGALRVSGHYRHTTNKWAQVTTVDHEGVSTRTWENFFYQGRVGGSITYSLPANPSVQGLFSVTGGRYLTTAESLGKSSSNDRIGWSGQVRLGATITEAFTAEGDVTYTPAVELPQGRSDPSYDIDFGFRYRLLERRASVRLALRDPFGLRQRSLRREDKDFIQVALSRESTRSATLRISYSFAGGIR